MKIIKILKYNVYGSGNDTYNHVCNLLSQNIDPQSSCSGELKCGNHTTYTSQLKRAVDCIDRSTAESVACTTLLNEIPFSLQKYCSENEYLKEGSVAVREAFIYAFIENNLDISHEQLRLELQQILSLGKSASPILCISHTFRMKIIEIYSKIGDELFEKPDIIINYIDPEKHIFDFGYTIELQE